MDGGHHAAVGVGEEDGHAVGDEDADRNSAPGGDEGVGLAPVDVVVRVLDDQRGGAVHLTAEAHRGTGPASQDPPVAPYGVGQVADVEPQVETLPRSCGHAAGPGREARPDPWAEVDGEDLEGRRGSGHGHELRP